MHDFGYITIYGFPPFFLSSLLAMRETLLLQYQFSVCTLFVSASMRPSRFVFMHEFQNNLASIALFEE